ncbi:MAG: serine/threonine-protein kinase [Nannocystaceae bacterium]
MSGGLESGATARPTPPPRDLADEAMRRRIAARLFGDAPEPVAIGRFTVVEALGRGGMGVVYAAEDPQLGRVVALKVIRDHGGDDDHTRAGERARLLREAQALARLSHPNVVHVYEVGEADEGVWVAMERIVGPTLAGWLAARRRSTLEIVAVFAQAARGLAAAHAAGLVHRDFKPTNVLVGDDGRARILDFGLARSSSAEATFGGAPAASLRGADPSRSSEGRGLAGTPAYMAPEQLRGDEVDARSDVFAFSVALFEALHGARPSTPEALLRGDAPTTTRPVGGRRLPGWLSRLLARGLALDPEARPEAMATIARALEVGPRRRRLLIGGSIVALVGGLALTGLLLAARAPAATGPAPCEDLRSTAAWDPEARAALLTAPEADAPAFAARSRERLTAALERYAGSLAAARREACVATRIRGERSPALMDRAMVCLDRAEAAFAELIALAGEGDPRTLAAADALVADLPSIAGCEDRARLLEGAAAAVDPAAEAVDAALREAERLRLARRAEEALAAIAAAEAGARALADDRRVAESLLLRAWIEGHVLLDMSLSTASLHAAEDAALRAGDLGLASRIHGELAFVAAHGDERPDLARRWLGHARAARRGPSDPLADAALLATEALILRLEGRASEAEATAAREQALLEGALPAAHPEQVNAALRRAHAIAERDPSAAIDALEPLLADARARLGDDHPSTALIDASLAQLHVERGAWGPARAHGGRAQAALWRLYGDDHPIAASVDLALASADAAEGATLPAIARAERALRIFDRAYPRGSSETIAALALLAGLDGAAGRDAAALEVHLRLLELADRLGLDLDRRGVLINIGEHLCRLDRCGEARPYFERSLALADDPEAPALRAFPLRGLGLLYLEAGDPAAAVPLLEEALARLEADPERSPATTAEVSRELASSLRALGRAPERARALIRRAEAIERAAAGASAQAP